MRGDDFYMRAFWDLSSCRQFGRSIGPIPWHSIVAYGDRKEFDFVMMRVFEEVMRELDEAYIEWQLEALKQGLKQGATK